MKKLWVLLTVLVLLAAQTAMPAAAEEDFGGATLNVYNWGEYIDEDRELLRQFEEKYNCRVNYKTFESNEILWTQLQAEEPWDVLVPSDYMIERLISQKMLLPLDKSLIPNLDQLDDRVKNLEFDPDNTYSVPYLWQSVGFVYDTTKIDPAKAEELGWDIFQDEEYKGHAYMYDSERDAFMTALKALGYSANTENEAEIEEAYEWLLQMNRKLEPEYVTDFVIDAMVDGYKWLAWVYSGDAAYIVSENENMAYCAPRQGTNIAYDCMVIYEKSQNVRLANLFINHILDYENSKAISLDVGYASPNRRVLEELSGPGGEYEGNEAYIPRSGYAQDEIYHDNEVLRSILSKYWIKVMSD